MKKVMGRKGFTLLELLIVLVILGTLVALAIPTYIKTVERSRQTEAIRVLGQLREAELRHSAEKMSYGALSALDAAPPADDTTLFNYTLTTPAGGAGFTATATRRGTLPTGVSSYTITLDHNGSMVKGY